MTAAPPPTGDQQPLSSRQAQVLGRVIKHDVIRDSAYVYRAGGTSDVDDTIYQLDELHLVDLLTDGRVVATTAGKQQWQQSRTSSRSNTPQFLPAELRPPA